MINYMPLRILLIKKGFSQSLWDFLKEELKNDKTALIMLLEVSFLYYPMMKEEHKLNP